MTHNKYTAIFLFLLSFTKIEREKNIERTFFVSAGAQRVRNSGFWEYFTTTSTESKK